MLLVGVVVVIGAHLVLDSVGKQPFARMFSNFSADGELVTAEGYGPRPPLPGAADT